MRYAAILMLGGLCMAALFLFPAPGNAESPLAINSDNIRAAHHSRIHKVERTRARHQAGLRKGHNFNINDVSQLMLGCENTLEPLHAEISVDVDMAADRC